MMTSNETTMLWRKSLRVMQNSKIDRWLQQQTHLSYSMQVLIQYGLQLCGTQDLVQGLFVKLAQIKVAKVPAKSKMTVTTSMHRYYFQLKATSQMQQWWTNQINPSFSLQVLIQVALDYYGMVDLLQAVMQRLAQTPLASLTTLSEIDNSSQAQDMATQAVTEMTSTLDPVPGSSVHQQSQTKATVMTQSNDAEIDLDQQASSLASLSQQMTKNGDFRQRMPWGNAEGR